MYTCIAVESTAPAAVPGRLNFDFVHQVLEGIYIRKTLTKALE
jgi:hypothetical protein